MVLVAYFSVPLCWRFTLQ